MTDRTTPTIAGSSTLDPIMLAVLRAGLLDAVDEMKAVVVRTAYSPLWKEAGDLSCGLLTGTGELLAAGRNDIPIHLATMPTSLDGCLRRFPLNTLEPGDVLFQNDPYQGNNHLPDFLMAKPVFFDGTLIAFSAVRGHFVDIGGSTPGSYTTATRDIFSEGLRVPPMKIYKRGEINEDIIEFLRANTRNSWERLGDLRSQVAGCQAGERRLIAFCERYGAAAVTGAMEAILDASERLTRSAIAEIPNGIYSFEDWCDGDGIDDKPFKMVVTVEIKDDEVMVDFTGTDPQVRGGMNAPPAVTASATVYAIKCLTDPENVANSGSMRPIHIIAPEGTVVNPTEPAPVVAGNHETASRIVDVVVGALSVALPERVAAAGSGSSGILALGAKISDATGKAQDVVMVESHGCGHGAGHGVDGMNARRVGVGNTGNTPTEVLEAQYPVHVTRYALNEDGGGAGKFRGGTSIVRQFSLLADATVTITAERGSVQPYGLFGGKPGALAQFHVTYPDGSECYVPSKTPGMDLPEGTIVSFRCAGGGGYGDPSDRAISDVQGDLDDGYISVDGATAEYAVEATVDPGRVEGSWVVSARGTSTTDGPTNRGA